MVIVLGNPILPVVGLPLHTYAQLPTSLLQGPPGFGHMLHGMGSRRLPYGALILRSLLSLFSRIERHPRKLFNENFTAHMAVYVRGSRTTKFIQ